MPPGTDARSRSCRAGLSHSRSRRPSVSGSVPATALTASCVLRSAWMATAIRWASKSGRTPTEFTASSRERLTRLPLRGRCPGVLSLDHDGAGAPPRRGAGPRHGQAAGSRPGASATAVRLAVRGGRLVGHQRPPSGSPDGSGPPADERGVRARIRAGGHQLAALPTPDRMLEISSFPGLTDDKIDRLHGIALAALGGQLDRIQTMDPGQWPICRQSRESGRSTAPSSSFGPEAMRMSSRAMSLRLWKSPPVVRAVEASHAGRVPSHGGAMAAILDLGRGLHPRGGSSFAGGTERNSGLTRARPAGRQVP